MRRLSLAIAGTLLALFVAATTSWSSGAAFAIADESGAPAAGAFVRYHYTGQLLNFVHPVRYIARGSAITRADEAGRVVIPGRVLFRRPLPLSGPPSLFVDHVYVPRLHNAFGPIAPLTQSRPGVFTVDDRRERVVVADVSPSPERWELSLRFLFDAIRGTLATTGSIAPAAPDDAATVAHARELIAHLRAEYAAFLARHGSAVRERPAPPPGGSERDRQAWQEEIDAQLRREPRWGPFMQRVWRGNLTELASLESRAR
jgi:hypothetical protein